MNRLLSFALSALALFVEPATATPRLDAFPSRFDVAPSQVFSINTVVANDSAHPLSDASVAIAVPSEFGSVTNLPTDASCNSPCRGGSTITWAAGSIPAGGAYVASFTTTLNDFPAPPAGTLIAVNAQLRSGAQAVATVNTQVRVRPSAANNVLQISSSLQFARPGERVLLSATFGNASSTATTLGNTLSLTLPQGFQVIDAGDGVLGASTVTWSIGALGPGSSGARNVLVEVQSSAEALRSVAATLQNSTESTEARTVLGVAQAQSLRVSVDTDAHEVERGRQFGVRIRVSNAGSASLNNVVVSSRLPQASNGPAAIEGGGTCPSGCSGAREIRWTIPTLAPGQSRVFSYAHDAASSGGVHALTGQVARHEAFAAVVGQRVMASSDVSLLSGRVLRVALDGPDRLRFGEETVLQIHAANLRTTPALGSRLKVRLPVGVQATQLDGAIADGNGGLTWDLGTLGPGQTVIKRISVLAEALQITPTQPSIFKDGFESDGNGTPGVSGALSSGLLYAEVLDNSSGARAARHLGLQTLPSRANLSLVVGPKPGLTGEILNGELTVGNSGSDLFGVMVYLRVPQEAGNWVLDGVGSCLNSCADGTLVRWNIGDLPAGTSRALSFSTRVSPFSPIPPSGAQIEFEAWAVEAANLDVTRVREVVPVGPRDLDLAIKDNRDPVLSGETLTYTLSYGNTTASTLTGVNLSLPLPPGTQFQSASDGGTHSAGVVSWSLGSLSPGVSGQRSVQVLVPTAQPGRMLETRARIADGSSRVSFASASTMQSAQRPLNLSLVVGPKPALTGEYLNGELTVGNSGSDLFGVMVYVRVPQETTSWVLDGVGSCMNSCADGTLVRWNIGDLPAGTSRALSFSTRVSPFSPIPPSGAQIEFEAWAVEAANLDVTRVREVVPVGPRDLDLAIKDNRDPVLSGETLTYTLSYGNTTASTLTGVNLSLPLPPGTQFQSASDGGTHSAGVVSWSLGSLSPGVSGQRVVQVLVPTAQAGRVLESSARIADGTGRVSHAGVSTAQATQRPLNLNISVLPGAVVRNEVVQGELQVSNAGAVALFGVIVNLRVPEETYSWTPADGGICLNSCSDGTLVRWNVGELGAGASATVRFSARINSSGNYPAIGQLVEFDTWGIEATNTNSVRAKQVMRVVQP